MGRRTGIASAVVAGVLLAGYLIFPPEARISRAGQIPPSPTVEVVGAAGSFGYLEQATRTPTGHEVTAKAVPGWGFEPGKAAYFNVLAPDGKTILIANEDQHENPIDQTADTMVVSTYDSGTGEFRNVRIKTSTGKSELAGLRQPGGADLGDLEVVGEAVAFTGPVPYSRGTGQDPATDGVWPVFGLLAEGKSGWEVADQWTAEQLHDSNPQLGDQACPFNQEAGMYDCLGLNELAALPRSHHLVATQYFPSAATGHHSGQLMVLRVDRRADAGYQVKVVGSFVFPDVRDPHDGRLLTVAPREVAADPTSVPGDERFAVGFDVFQADGGTVPAPVQEFSYDERTGVIQPVSAPVLPGELSELTDAKGVARFKSYANFRYDHQGNLWVGRRDVPPDATVDDHIGGRLAVYAKTGDGRRLTVGNCAFGAKPSWDDYVSAGQGARSSWGLSCPADYQVGQTGSVAASWGLAEDPQTHLMVQIMIDGSFMAVRPQGSGSAMSFEVGPVVDVGRSLLPARHEVAGGTMFGGRQGVIDSRHRLWYPVQQFLAGRGPAYAPLDQWLFRVDTTDLFQPSGLAPPAGLTATVGPDGSVALTWAESFPDAWYWVYTKDLSVLRAPYTRARYPISDGTSHKIAASALQPGHTYAFYVTTTGPGGESPPSALAQVTATLAAPSGLTALSNPDGSITLTWTAPYPGAWFWVYARDLGDPAAAFRHGSYPVVGGTSLTIPRSLLIPGHTYAYYLTTVGPAGESPATQIVQATVR